MEEQNEQRVYIDPHDLFSTFDKVKCLSDYSHVDKFYIPMSDWDKTFIKDIEVKKYVTEKVQHQVDLMFKKFITLDKDYKPIIYVWNEVSLAK